MVILPHLSFPLIIKGLQNMPFCVPKRPVLESQTARFSLRNGLFCKPKWHVLKCCQYFSHSRYGNFPWFTVAYLFKVATPANIASCWCHNSYYPISCWIDCAFIFFLFLYRFRKKFVSLHHPSHRVEAYAEARRVGDIYGIAFTNACSWRAETSQLSITVKEHSNSRCLVGVYSSTLLCALLSCNAHLGYLIYHIGVGFCVARSDCDGQCEGLCA